MIRKKLFLLLLLLSVNSNFICGQTLLPAVTANFPIQKQSGSNYKMIPLGPKGVIVFLKSNKTEKGKIKLSFSKLDVNLKKVAESEIKVEAGTIVVDYVSTEHFLYFLLFEKDDSYNILKINLENLKYNFIEYKNIKNYFITHFQVVADRFAFFGGKIKSYPALIAYDFKTGQSTIFSSVNQLKANLADMSIDSENNIVSVVLWRNSPLNKRGFYINQYNFEGKILSNFFFKTDKHLKLLSFSTIILSRRESLFVGTYSETGSDESDGLYAMKVAEKQVVFLKKHPFIEMPYFLKFLNDTKAKKLLARAKKRKRHQKSLFFPYKSFLQPLFFTPNGLMAILDIYRAQSEKGEGFQYAKIAPPASGYGSATDPSLERFIRASRNYRTFVPVTIPKAQINPNKPFPLNFQYLTTLVCTLDPAGNLSWSNSFPYEKNKIRTDLPLQMTALRFNANKSSLLRLIFNEKKQEEIRIKEIERGVFTDSTTKILIKPLTEEKTITSYEYGGFLHWHEDNFLVSGLKETLSGGKREDVYFLKKITFSD